MLFMLLVYIYICPWWTARLPAVMFKRMKTHHTSPDQPAPASPLATSPISCVNSFRAVKLLVLNLAKWATTMGKTRAKRHPSMQSIPQDVGCGSWGRWYKFVGLDAPDLMQWVLKIIPEQKWMIFLCDMLRQVFWFVSLSSGLVCTCFVFHHQIYTCCTWIFLSMHMRWYEPRSKLYVFDPFFLLLKFFQVPKLPKLFVLGNFKFVNWILVWPPLGNNLKIKVPFEGSIPE